MREAPCSVGLILYAWLCRELVYGSPAKQRSAERMKQAQEEADATEQQHFQPPPVNDDDSEHFVEAVSSVSSLPEDAAGDEEKDKCV